MSSFTTVLPVPGESVDAVWVPCVQLLRRAQGGCLLVSDLLAQLLNLGLARVTLLWA
jgi:hypothetical protein